MEGRMSRWNLINSEKIINLSSSEEEKSVILYKGIPLYNLINIGLTIPLGAHYEMDMFDVSLHQIPIIKITSPYPIKLKYTINMKPNCFISPCTLLNPLFNK